MAMQPPPADRASCAAAAPPAPPRARRGLSATHTSPHLLRHCRPVTIPHALTLLFPAPPRPALVCFAPLLRRASAAQANVMCDCSVADPAAATRSISIAATCARKRRQQLLRIQHQHQRHGLHTLAVLSQLRRRRLLCQPPPPRWQTQHTENKACCALPDAYRRPLRRTSPASPSSCAEYARHLPRIEFAVRESCCAGPEPDTWELQKLFLQDANSHNIIWLQFHNFET